MCEQAHSCFTDQFVGFVGVESSLRSDACVLMFRDDASLVLGPSGFLRIRITELSCCWEKNGRES
jgi:hypothetical protein